MKVLFARLVIRKEIQVKKFLIDIAKITAKLMKHFNRNMVGRNEFFMSLILYYLSERKHDFEQLNEKLCILNTKMNLARLLSTLIENKFIEKVDDFYKIKVDRLF